MNNTPDRIPDPEMMNTKRAAVFGHQAEEEPLNVTINKRADQIMKDDMELVIDRIRKNDLWDDFLVDLGAQGYQKDWMDKGLDNRTTIRTIARELAKEQLEDEGIY